MLLKLPALEYPITRRFGSAWLTSLAYVIGFLAVVILAIANGQSMLHLLPDACAPTDGYLGQSP